MEVPIRKSGDLEIQKCGVQKKNLKIQIRSAQIVGKVWISRKKSSWPYLGPSEAILFALVSQWAPIHPVCCTSLLGKALTLGAFRSTCETQSGVASFIILDVLVYLFPHLGWIAARAHTG